MSGNERPSFYKKVDEGPPEFITRNEDEKKLMFEWTVSRLHDWAEANEWSGTRLDRGESPWSPWTNVDAALGAAEHGDVEPLRFLFPDLARFINLPTRPDHSPWPKQKRWPYPPRDGEEGRKDRIELAAAETMIVRAIWKKHYVRSNQRKDFKASQWTPEEIVAKRWDVTPDEVRERLKRP